MSHAQHPTVGEIDTDHDYPTEWADVSARLIPLLEVPRDWFDDPVVQYETTLGPFGDVVDLSPEAVTFNVNVRRDEYPELFQWSGHHVGENDTLLVPNQTAAEGQDETAVWVDEGDVYAHLYERVPFEERVTTLDELQSQLAQIMDNPPEWDELMGAVTDTAVGMGVIESADQSGETGETGETDDIAGGIPDAAVEDLHSKLGGDPMDAHVEGAIETLTDDDLIAFALVAVREDDDGNCEVSPQRAIDPLIAKRPEPSEQIIDRLHTLMMQTFDQEIATK
jgi:hypothetical protein